MIKRLKIETVASPASNRRRTPSKRTTTNKMASTPPWSASDLEGDSISKKQLVEFLQATASSEFLKRLKLNGKVPNIVKASSRPHLISSYNELFDTKEFRNEEEEAKIIEETAKQVEQMSVKEVAPKKEQPKELEKPKYKKSNSQTWRQNKFPKERRHYFMQIQGHIGRWKSF